MRMLIIKADTIEQAIEAGKKFDVELIEPTVNKLALHEVKAFTLSPAIQCARWMNDKNETYVTGFGYSIGALLWYKEI